MKVWVSWCLASSPQVLPLAYPLESVFSLASLLLLGFLVLTMAPPVDLSWAPRLTELLPALQTGSQGPSQLLTAAWLHKP